MFAGHVLVVELPLFHRQDRGVARAARLEGAELGTLQRHRGVHRARRDHVAQRHAHAEELRQRRHLIVGRAFDAQRVHVGRDRVGIEAVRQHRPCGLERK